MPNLLNLFQFYKPHFDSDPLLPILSGDLPAKKNLAGRKKAIGNFL